MQCTYKCFISLPLNDLTGHNRTKKEYKDEYPTKQKSDCPNLRKHPSKCLGRATFCLPIKGTLKTLEQMCLIDSLRSLLMVWRLFNDHVCVLVAEPRRECSRLWDCESRVQVPTRTKIMSSNFCKCWWFERRWQQRTNESSCCHLVQEHRRVRNYVIVSAQYVARS
jgi:hypothetical protein